MQPIKLKYLPSKTDKFPALLFHEFVTVKPTAMMTQQDIT